MSMKHISSVLAVTAIALFGPASSAFAAYPYPYYGQYSQPYQQRIDKAMTQLQNSNISPQRQQQIVQQVQRIEDRYDARMQGNSKPAPVPPQNRIPPPHLHGPSANQGYPCNG